jgi:hypothetical protein
MMADLPPPSDWLHNLVGMRLVDVIFGASGGVVRGLVVKNLSWSQRIASTVVGALTAGSVGPAANALASRWFDWWGFPLSTVEIGGSVIFIVGLVGMTICDAVIRWARLWRDGPPPPFFSPPKSSG